MIIVAQALRDRERTGEPMRVGMVGAGAMGRGVALQILTAVRGMELSVICNRHPEAARRAYLQAGADKPRHVEKLADLETAVASGRAAITDDYTLVCGAEAIDVVFEVTGTVEFGAHVVLEAIAQGKRVVTMNAELQGTLGPLLKRYAGKAGVVLTDSDGDQPGVIMNLYRFAQGIGCRPVLAGNIKGLHDPYRNPTTQEGFAKRRGLTPNMATSFADGTKISFEMAIVANATGLRVAKRGMHGPSCASVHQAIGLLPVDSAAQQGIVDYVVGAEPAPGVFLIGHQEHPIQRAYLDLYKLGEGPFYTFYRPYHLCHFEVPSTIARAVLFGDSTVTPMGRPMVDVVAAAKRDLRSGEILDGIGWYMTYGLAENAEIAAQGNLLPMGLAGGAKVVRDVPQDQVLSYGDVELPEGRLSDAMRTEQATVFTQGAAA